MIGEGIRRVTWNSYEGELRNSFWVNRSQREHVVGPSNGSWVYHKSVVNKVGLESSKWVSTNQREHSRALLSVADSAQECNNQVGFPVFLNLEPIGPIRKVVGVSPSSGDQSPLKHDAQASAMPHAPHEVLVAQVARSGVTGVTGATGEGRHH